MPTGISIAIPVGWCGLVLPRSGLALKHGISVVNAPGLIDAAYRGEIKVVLINTDPERRLRDRSRRSRRPARDPAGRAGRRGTSSTNSTASTVAAASATAAGSRDRVDRVGRAGATQDSVMVTDSIGSPRAAAEPLLLRVAECVERRHGRVEPFGHRAEQAVLRRQRGAVRPGDDEELAAVGVRLAGVGHRERADRVLAGQSGVRRESCTRARRCRSPSGRRTGRRSRGSTRWHDGAVEVVVASEVDEVVDRAAVRVPGRARR